MKLWKGRQLMNYAELFREDLVQMKGVFANQEALFEGIFKDLLKKSLVEQTFLKAVKQREESYPTGLQLENMSIAIPHTDVEHVIEPFVYVYKLEQTVRFIQMGTNDVPVDAEAVLVLGIKEPKEQVGMLSGLMAMFSDQAFIQKFKEAETEREVIQLLKQQMVLSLLMKHTALSLENLF